MEDFHSWTLVNHYFYEIAVPLIYETLNVRFTDHRSLQHIVTEIEKNPLRRQCLIYARRLNVMAMQDSICQEIFSFDCLSACMNTGIRDEHVRARDLIPDRFGCPGYFFNKQMTAPLPLTLKIWREPGGFYDDRNWEPLMWLIGRMMHLTEMHYLLKNMFPKCLLEVIHKHHPNCQLNVWGTQMLQLREPGLQGILSSDTVVPEFREPFEIDLLRSPCLHSISMFFSVDIVAKTEVAVEDIFPLITMAPNLKHINIRENFHRSHQITEMNQGLSEYLKSKISPQYVAAPISLRHQGSGFSFESIKEWGKSTDFSSLRAFEFPEFYYPLKIMDQLSKFPKLEYLYLGLQNIGPMQEHNFVSDLSSMFAGLKPLKYLRVRCPRDTAIIHEIFSHHGSTLRGIHYRTLHAPWSTAISETSFIPLFNASDIVSLSRQAPYLEEFRLPLRRSLGNQTECELYDALGNFPSLHSLVLDLDCNFRESIARDFNHFSDQSPELPTHKIFINAAMDETLAKGIWDRVDLSGGGKRLRKLRISIIGITSLRRPEGEIARRLARSFLISRSMSYTGAYMKVREIGKELIDLQTARQSDYDLNSDEPFEVPKQVQEVVSSLWPFEHEEFTLNFEWKSFPLEVTT